MILSDSSVSRSHTLRGNADNLDCLLILHLALKDLFRPEGRNKVVKA
jgi:hypothetical protein